MQVTITHPITNFAGIITVLENVVVTFTGGTATVDIPSRAVGIFRDMGCTIGGQGPGRQYDTSFDVQASSAIQDSSSSTAVALKAVVDAEGTAQGWGATGGGVVDATTTTKGKIKLAGDLAGTADAPTVPGLASKASTSHTHAATDLTTGTVAPARLGSGTASNATVLYGDSVWRVAPTGGGGGGTGMIPADVIISTDGTTITATARPGSGLTSTSGTDAYTVIQGMINSLTWGGGNGGAGGRIHITRGFYGLSDELTINGWEGTNNPESQLIITGDGYSTSIAMQQANKNALVIKNSANFTLRDLRFYSGGTSKSCLLLDNTGTTFEQSSMKGVIDNVEFGSDSTGYPAAYLKNFFDLSVPSARFMNSSNHGLVLENNSTTINYGNSNFGFIRCGASSAAPYAGLVIRTVNNSKYMNMLSFANYECIAGYYGIYTMGAWNTKFGFVDIERTCTKPIFFDGSSTQGDTRNVWVSGGYLWPATGGTAITCTQYTGACSFDLYIETTGDNTAVPILDQSQFRAPNRYAVTLNNTASVAKIAITSPKITPLRIRNFPDASLSDTHAADAKIFIHGGTTAAARPSTPLPVVWIGTAQPTNMADGDVYLAVTAG